MQIFSKLSESETVVSSARLRETSGPKAPRPDHRHDKALDGLRWFAFLGVFLFHANERWFPYGKTGVQVFFVLSGFLIGRILLNLKAQQNIPFHQHLKTFYIRRALRIFPLYYAVLGMIFILPHLGITSVGRQHLLPWHAAYLTNYYIFRTHEKIDSHTHFWSLDVEEHFYLLAPLLILLLPWKRIERGMIGLWITIATLRLLNFFVFRNIYFDYLSPMQFDILTIGIAAAIIEKTGAFYRITYSHLLSLGKFCGLAFLAILCCSYGQLRIPQFVDTVLLPWILAVGSAALVLGLWAGSFQTLGRFLSRPIFVYLGKISYGLYIFHNFSFIIGRNATGLKHILLNVAALSATIIIASLSWHLFENPVNRLKRFFPYSTSLLN